MCAALATAQLRSGPGWELYCVGNCSAPAAPRAARAGRGGVVLMGGGTDVESALVWLVEQGRGGDIVVLRAGPPADDAYDAFIYGLARCRSVSTLIVHNASAARAPQVLHTLAGAAAIFLVRECRLVSARTHACLTRIDPPTQAGGDQSVYYTLWHSSGGGAIARTLNAAIVARTPIGGTSAGMAALAGVAFTAARGEVFSGAALRDPLSPNITLVTNFLHVSPWLDAVITDMHFGKTRPRV